MNKRTYYGPMSEGWIKAVLIQEADLPTVADCCRIAKLIATANEARDLAIARAAAEWGYQYALEDDDVLTDDFTPDDNVLRAIIAQVDETAAVSSKTIGPDPGEDHSLPTRPLAGRVHPGATEAKGTEPPHMPYWEHGDETAAVSVPIASQPSARKEAKEAEPPQNRILADFREKYPDQHYYMRGTADEHARAVAVLKAMSWGGQGNCWCGVELPRHTDWCLAARAYCEEKP